MRLLLDTHVWVWSLLDPDALKAGARRALEDAGNELWLSPVSTWELLVLIERGRIEMDGPADDFVTAACSAAPLREAVLTHQVAMQSRRLKWRHEDPADRFLVATALVYDLTLVTADRAIQRGRPCSILGAL